VFLLIVKGTQVNDKPTQSIVEQHDFNDVRFFDVEAGFCPIVEVTAANDEQTNFNVCGDGFVDC
jgi:hypothetical protein